MSTIGVMTFPEGTAALNLHGLVETMLPVVVEYGGQRFALTGWNEDYGVFDAIQLRPDESPEEARRRVVSAMGEDYLREALACRCSNHEQARRRVVRDE